MTTTIISIKFSGLGHTSTGSATAPDFREAFLHARVMLALPPAFAERAHVAIESADGDYYSAAANLATLDEMLTEARENAVTA